MNNVYLSGLAQINALRQEMIKEIKLGGLTKTDAPIKHYHANGLYGRRMYVDAGTTIISKVHLTQHFTIALKGTCTVLSETGKKFVVTAPDVWVSEIGTYRAIYCHDDVEWLTVHHTELTDVEQIEHQIACESYDEFDNRKDYLKFLSETGFTENLMQQISENPDNLMDFSENLLNIEIKESILQGFGVFAIRDFDENEKIGVARLNTMRTQIGRYTNHSGNPNCIFKLCDNYVVAIAKKPIKLGDEITVDYRNALAVANKMRILK